MNKVTLLRKARMKVYSLLSPLSLNIRTLGHSDMPSPNHLLIEDVFVAHFPCTKTIEMKKRKDSKITANCLVG